jgi:hypothetical protein
MLKARFKLKSQKIKINGSKFKEIKNKSQFVYLKQNTK